MTRRRLQQIQILVNYLEQGRWLQESHFNFSCRVRSRQEVWASAVKRVESKPILYLEFGVARGESMSYWSRQLKHPAAALHGFDSFEGLPENAGLWHKGQFSTGGIVPKFADPRVRLFKGWFDQTLPAYTFPDHELLLINMDADLYSSTHYVLQHLRPHIRPGTLIYFDEFHCVEHEPRAFAEFIQQTGSQFHAICADEAIVHTLFECVG